MYCQALCRDLNPSLHCQHEPSRHLRDLGPYDHLRRFFRLCLVHFKRNIHDLRAHIADDVRIAMLSLASSDPHPDIEMAFQLIESGGAKARAWLKDKCTGSPFALPALYQPYSFIPLDVWKASPPSSNGNEQSHRAVYRDGINLTILGGTMRGWQYDHRAFRSLDVYASQGIYTRDQASTHFYRFGRSVDRVVSVQRRTAHRALVDVEQNASNADLLPSAPAPDTSFVLDSDFFNTTNPHLFRSETPASDIILDEDLMHHDNFPCSSENKLLEDAHSGKSNQYPRSNYSEIAGALDMVPTKQREPYTWRLSQGDYLSSISVSGQGTPYNNSEHTFVAVPLPEFIPYNPDLHSSLFSTLHNALLDS